MLRCARDGGAAAGQAGSARGACAASGAEARDLMRAGDQDLMLLDYQLGDSTGLELLPLAGDIPAIFITGMGNEEVAVKAIQMGAYDYIAKPVAPDEVITATNGAVTQKRWSLQRDGTGKDGGTGGYAGARGGNGSPAH